MNKDLQTILDLSQQSEHLTEEDKRTIAKAVKAVDSKIVIQLLNLTAQRK